MLSSKILVRHQKPVIEMKNFCHRQAFFLLKNTFKVALQYLFNILILLNIVFNHKLNFLLKIDPKKCTFKNL